MPKSIVVLKGSPRRGGNSDRLADAFIVGAMKQGCRVETFVPAVDVVRPCIACDACWTKAKPCVFDDGFDKLAASLEQCETLVLATPVYWFGVTAQLKAAIDKLYAYGSAPAERRLAIRETALLVAAEGDEDWNFAGTLEMYRGIVRYKEWRDRGVVIAGGVNAVGDIDGHAALVEARALGESM